MRKAVALLGLVLIPLGFGGIAAAIGPGSDSSGTYHWTTECGGGNPEYDIIGIIFTNNSNESLKFYTPSSGEQPIPPSSQTGGMGWGFQGDLGEIWEVRLLDGTVVDSGLFDECATDTTSTTQPNVPDVAPELISECRGQDWWLVHPDDSPSVTYAYRMSTGDILYDADYTSNNPAAVYGEVLIPVGTDEVGYADDFNVSHTATRPDCTVTAPTTPTAEPGTPEAPNETPETPSETPTDAPGLAPMEGDGFVAPGADINPGMATFGVTGFAPGEQVTVTLFSTPRELGTVTAADSGNASITFELLASDGAGEHRVQFSGPSGTLSVPFTLVLPAQSLPETR